MNSIKILILIILVVCLVAIPSLSCASKSNPDAVLESQVVTVERGNLTIEVIASGNLSLSRIEELAFEMVGTVEEVLVEEGDSVKEGQVLARLDASEWEDEVIALERKLITKKRDLFQVKVSLKSSEYTLERAEEPIRASGRSISVIYIDPLDIEIKELQVEMAQARVEDAQIALEDAQKELDDTKSLSTVIKAPFTGFITTVNVDGGDEIKKGTVGVILADPTKFEASILIGEMDIFGVRPGGKATVQLDAMPELIFPGKVTHISPTAEVSEGVVNYEIEVQVESLKPVKPSKPEKDKAKEKREGEQPQKEEKKQKSPSTAPKVIQLREGLSVTVSILIEEKNDVLLVPNKAIVRQRGKNLVQVLKDGVTEEREIKTGLGTMRFTEVKEGLSEGEKLVIPRTTSATSGTSTPGGQHTNIPGGRRGLVR